MLFKSLKNGLLHVYKISCDIKLLPWNKHFSKLLLIFRVVFALAE